MNFDPVSLMVAFVVSGIGFILFSFGRKMQRPPQVVSGIALMVFPYFTPSPLWMALIALGILAALWAALAYGV